MSVSQRILQKMHFFIFLHNEEWIMLACSFFVNEWGGWKKKKEQAKEELGEKKKQARYG